MCGNTNEAKDWMKMTRKAKKTKTSVLSAISTTPIFGEKLPLNFGSYPDMDANLGHF